MAKKKTSPAKKLVFIIIIISCLSLAITFFIYKNNSNTIAAIPTTSNTKTAEENGAKMTIDKTQGKVGTNVTVKIEGLKPSYNGPFVNISFRDSSGAYGEDNTTTKYTYDSRKLGSDGTYSVSYIIPFNVLVLAHPGDQNPTKLAPTNLGEGAIVFHGINSNLEVPFTVTK